jgi:hypothetical protein
MTSENNQPASPDIVDSDQRLLDIMHDQTRRINGIASTTGRRVMGLNALRLHSGDFSPDAREKLDGITLGSAVVAKRLVDLAGSGIADSTTKDKPQSRGA